jgi:cell division protein FtsN
VNEPFYLVRIGPISSARRASEIAGQLTLEGFTARVSRAEGGTRYMITLGPHRRSAADTIAKLVASRFGAGVPVAVNRVP